MPEPGGIGKQLANARLEVVGGTQCVLRVSSPKVSAKPHFQTLGTPAAALDNSLPALPAEIVLSTRGYVGAQGVGVEPGGPLVLVHWESLRFHPPPSVR